MRKKFSQRTCRAIQNIGIGLSIVYVHTELHQLRAELQTGIHTQFWQFATLVLPLWLAAAALFLRH